MTAPQEAAAATHERAPRAVPVWAGIVVSDIERAVGWYTDTLHAAVRQTGPSYAELGLADGSVLELVAGDPARPGTAFPSYRDEPGPSVMPGFRVEDPAELGRGLTVARWLPDWVVVVGPQRLRAVLNRGEGDGRHGLLGFRVVGPEPALLVEWFATFGASVEAVAGDRLEVVPLVAGDTDRRHTDPDGTAVVTVAG